MKTSQFPQELHPLLYRGRDTVGLATEKVECMGSCCLTYLSVIKPAKDDSSYSSAHASYNFTQSAPPDV